MNITEARINGDFRSEDCTTLLKQADIVVTNPPFSLFRDFFKWLMDNKKDFIIVGNKNAITFKEVFPYLKEAKCLLGVTSPVDFIQPYSDVKKEMKGLTRWFTNVDLKKHHETIILTEKYTPEKYPKYDNYDAIEVSKVTAIPCDYYGVMGVPITFMDKYNPDQFEILGCTANPESNSVEKHPRSSKALELIKQGRLKGASCVGGNSNIYIDEDDYVHVIYHRILIKRRTTK